MSGAFDLIYAIVQRGRGKEIAQLSRGMGALGGLSTEAHGTATNEMQDLLGLDNKERTIVQVLCRHIHTMTIMREMTRVFSMQKAGHGIAFCVPIASAKGLNAMFRLRDKYCQPVSTPEEVEEEKMEKEYDLLTAIVKNGYADDAMQAARAAGAEGGTIIHGRGMSIRENTTLFGVAIQPEKDVLLCVIPRPITKAVMEKITEVVGLDKPGQGIVYTVQVNHVMGIAHGFPANAMES